MILFRIGAFPVTWLVVVIALAVLLDLILVLVPIALILRRAGFSGWWALLRLLPVVHLVFLWVFAVAPWPALDTKR